MEQAKVTMTVFEVLAEIARINQKLETQLRYSSVAVIVGQGDKRRFVTSDGTIPYTEENSKELASAFQSRLDLLKRREMLKAALVQSNATTFITLAGEQYSIAQAIEMRKMLPQYKSLITLARNGYSQALRHVTELNVKCDDKIEAASIVARKEFVDLPEIDAIIARRTQAIEAEHRASVLDPANANGVADKLEMLVIDIESNLDSLINISNVQTLVEIVDRGYLVKVR